MFIMFTTCLTCMCMCVYTCVCMCVCMEHPHTPTLIPTPINPSAPGNPWNQLKFDNTNQGISIPFEDLKSVKNSPPMCGCMVRWVGGWMGGLMGGGGQNTKNFKNVD